MAFKGFIVGFNLYSGSDHWVQFNAGLLPLHLCTPLPTWYLTWAQAKPLNAPSRTTPLRWGLERSRMISLLHDYENWLSLAGAGPIHLSTTVDILAVPFTRFVVFKLSWRRALYVRMHFTMTRIWSCLLSKSISLYLPYAFSSHPPTINLENNESIRCIDSSSIWSPVLKSASCLKKGQMRTLYTLLNWSVLCAHFELQHLMYFIAPERGFQCQGWWHKGLEKSNCGLDNSTGRCLETNSGSKQQIWAGIQSWANWVSTVPYRV